jgi:shikimate dehydrogenase
MSRNPAKIIAIFGRQLGYSLSPKFQNAGLKALGLNASYVAHEVPSEKFAAEFRSFFSKSETLGANITNPYKVRVKRLVDHLTEEARAIGSVNTVLKKNGKLIGHNTDGYGFKSAFKHDFGRPANSEKILILGAGGTARSILWGLPQRDKHFITVAARRLDSGIYLKRQIKYRKDIKVVLLNDSSKVLLFNDHEIVINTVSDPNFTIEISKGIPYLGVPQKKVFDVNYAIGRDKIYRAAKAAHYHSENGLRMLLEQGCKSFEFWTGKKAPKAVMAAKLGLKV